AHAVAVTARKRAFVALTRWHFRTAFQTAAGAVPQGVALVAGRGFAGRAFRFADGPLQLGARQAAIQFAVVAVRDVPARNDLGRRVRDIAIIDADSLKHDLLLDAARGGEGHPHHLHPALDVQALDGVGIGLVDVEISPAAARHAHRG